MANRLMKDLLPSTTASHWSSRGRSAVVGCWLSQKLTAKTIKSSSVVSSLFLARRTSLSRQTTQFATPSMREYVLYSLSWLYSSGIKPSFLLHAWAAQLGHCPPTFGARRIQGVQWRWSSCWVICASRADNLLRSSHFVQYKWLKFNSPD